MTSIKPPSGRGPGPLGSVEGPSGAEAPDAAKRPAEGPSFSEVLRAASSQPTAAVQGQGSAAVLAALEAGQIDRETAVTRLVEASLARVQGTGLSDGMKRDLAAFLRGQLESDPTLRALLGPASGEE